jgi:hypothetical protein
MTPAEISLAFAREVAGYPDACYEDWFPEGSPYNPVLFDKPREFFVARELPDYANDWNATIAVLEQRRMPWGTEYVGGQKYFWVESGSLFKIEEGKGPSALMLAAVKCVREQGNG